MMRQYSILILIAMLAQGCHFTPPYHMPHGYSSTYVKSLKCGPQGGATPLYRSIITKPERYKNRMMFRNIFDDSSCLEDPNLAPSTKVINSPDHENVLQPRPEMPSPVMPELSSQQ